MPPEPHLPHLDLVTAGISHGSHAGLRRSPLVAVRSGSVELDAWKHMSVRLRERKA